MVDISYFIPKGEENAVTSKFIEAQTGLKGSEIRHLVNISRQDGVPICSGCKGYFVARNEEEITHTVNSFNSRIRKMAKARDGIINSQLKNIQTRCDENG